MDIGRVPGVISYSPVGANGRMANSHRTHRKVIRSVRSDRWPGSRGSSRPGEQVSRCEHPSLENPDVGQPVSAFGLVPLRRSPRRGFDLGNEGALQFAHQCSQVVDDFLPVFRVADHVLATGYGFLSGRQSQRNLPSQPRKP